MSLVALRTTVALVSGVLDGAPWLPPVPHPVTPSKRTPMSVASPRFAFSKSVSSPQTIGKRSAGFGRSESPPPTGTTAQVALALVDVDRFQSGAGLVPEPGQQDRDERSLRSTDRRL